MTHSASVKKEQDSCTHPSESKNKKHVVGCLAKEEKPAVLALVTCMAASCSAKACPFCHPFWSQSLAVLGQDEH